MAILERRRLASPGAWLLMAAAAMAGAPPSAMPSARPQSPTLAERVDEVLATPAYRTADWGLLVVDARTGEIVYEREADRLFRPASVAKLFSTAAALAELGADFRFHTAVKRRGTVDPAGTLQGDLILVASGDLALGGRTGPDGNLLFTDVDHSYASGSASSSVLVSIDPMAPLSGLDALAREVQANGIKLVAGDVIVDDRLFELAPSTGSGPSQVSPIVINDNLIDILVAPGAKVGEPATASQIPQSAFVSVDARVTTSEKGAKANLRLTRISPRAVHLSGTIPLEHPPVVQTMEMTEPAAFARALLIECLRRRGVEVAGSPLGSNRVDRLPSRAEVQALDRVAEYTSPPFSEYLKVILKVSQNLHASTLPMLLAAGQQERTLTAGLARESVLLRELGVDVGTISLSGGGAGGSDSDLVTPRATVALLQAMAERPDFPVYQAALPVLGRDGTLAKAVGAESPARGHVRAKTGTYSVTNGLTGQPVLTSKSLAGYMETAAGRKLVFAIFLNDVCLDVPMAEVGTATATAGQTLARLCELFYDDKPAEPSAPVAADPPAAVAPAPATPAPATSAPTASPSATPAAASPPAAGAAGPGL